MKELFGFVHRKLRFSEAICRSMPSAFILAGLLLGILPRIMESDGSGRWWLLGSAVAAVSGFLLLPYKSAVAFVSAILIGFFTTLFSTSMHSPAALLRIPACGAEVRVEVTDPKCTGEQIAWLPNPGLVSAQLLEFRYNDRDSWHIEKQDIAIRLPRELKPVEYGEILSLRGSFQIPEHPLVPGMAFDFHRYLMSRGNRLVFEAEEEIGNRTSARTLISRICSRLLTFRNRMLNEITNDVKIPENRTIIAALLFGCKQGLSYSDRRNYLRSGTIHLFAVSGLHVGMIALVLFLLLRWIPFTFRHLLVPVILTTYVITIGFQPSALRALMMIGIWSCLRALLRTAHPLNTVFLTACIILIINPLSILDPGFQYSFLVTSFLVLSWHSIHRWLMLTGEMMFWVPPTEIGFIRRWRRRLFAMVASTFLATLVACLAGGALTLYYQGLAVPAAVVVNFLLQPVIWLFFVVSAVKMVVIWLNPLSLLLTSCMERLLALFQLTVDFAAEHIQPTNISCPPAWILPLFFVALAVAVGTGNRRLWKLGVVLTAGIAAFWITGSIRQSHEVWIFHGGENQVPSVMVCPAGRNDVWLFDAPSPNLSHTLVELLPRLGKERIRLMGIQRAVKDHCHGLPILVLSGFPIDRVFFPENFQRSNHAKRGVDMVQKSGINLDFYAKKDNGDSMYSLPGFRFARFQNDRSVIVLQINPQESMIIEITVNPTTGENKIQVICPSSEGPKYRYVIFPRSSVADYLRLEF